MVSKMGWSSSKLGSLQGELDYIEALLHMMREQIFHSLSRTYETYLEGGKYKKFSKQYKITIEMPAINSKSKFQCDSEKIKQVLIASILTTKC